jgi:hypothetical protein
MDVENESEQPRKRRSRLRMGAALATVATLVGIATGVLTLRDQLFSDDEDSPRSTSPGEREIPRFDGVAGHFAEGRALVDFLEQHNRETVYLDVGFPDHLTGPGGGDNVISKDVPFQGGSRYVVTNLTLGTECSTDIPQEDTNPPIADGCQGTSLHIDGPETEDSRTFFEHGVPRIKGHFRVDDTGGLYMGLRPINLKPLTFEQATGSG